MKPLLPITTAALLGIFSIIPQTSASNERALSYLDAAGSHIEWTGDFGTGDFIQWHNSNNTSRPDLWGIPTYCRPEGDTSYYGNGSCLELVNDPVRKGSHSAKFTVKNSNNGEEPKDCDPMGDRCERRRSELGHEGQARYYDAMPYMTERWMSVSFYVPEDWDTDGSGWGVILFQVKPIIESGLSPALAISLTGNTWEIKHRSSDVENPSRSDVPWQRVMSYRADSPIVGASTTWAGGIADYPDQAKSEAALGNLNKGGWTDWVIHVKYDARGAADGGTGFLRFYKREDEKPWTKVVDIAPGYVTTSGETFDRGIAYNSPARSDSNGGFGLRVGMYGHKDQFWNLADNRSIYIDNVQIGNERASLDLMAPTEGPSSPAPPTSLTVN